MGVELVAFQPDFAEAFHQWRHQQTFVLYNPLLPLDLKACRKRLTSESSKIEDIWTSSTLRWFIRSDGQVVGNVSLNSINKMMLNAEIGYGIGEQFQGKGFGTRGVSAMLEMIFSKTALRKIFAHVHEENVFSRRLLEKLGFKAEGLLREHYIVNGKPTNEVIFGLLKREFKPGVASTSPQS